MNIKEKMDLAFQLLNEVQEEILKGDLPDTATNNQIRGLIRTFGNDHFIEGVDTMRLWVNDMDLLIPSKDPEAVVLAQKEGN